MAWNHNLHYHDFVLRSMPSPCLSALDIGCGRGELARKLALRSQSVTAIDSDAATLAAAQALNPPVNIAWLNADFLTCPLSDDGYDFIVCVAVRHHLPPGAALQRMRALLRPGGTLAVVGLYRNVSVIDYAVGAIAGKCATNSIPRCQEVNSAEECSTGIRSPGGNSCRRYMLS